MTELERPILLNIFKSLVLLISIYLYTNCSFGLDKIVAIDGVSGFVGSSLIKDLQSSENLKIGCYDCKEQYFGERKYLKGNICDPKYLIHFLNNVDIYYQMAALSSVEDNKSILEYLLTNSIAPYIASRVNKNMNMLTISTIAVADIEKNKTIESWVKELSIYLLNIDNKFNEISIGKLSDYLSGFIQSHGLPNLNNRQYYGFSKFVMEYLLMKSSLTRAGKIFIVRSALVVGDGVHNRKTPCVVKNMVEAVFDKNKKYQVWNRMNYFTPLDNLKSLMLYVSNHCELFDKFEIIDGGWVEMHQHDFVKLMAKSLIVNTNLDLVEHSFFQRKFLIKIDERLVDYYPSKYDLERSVDKMLVSYNKYYVDLQLNPLSAD